MPFRSVLVMYQKPGRREERLSRKAVKAALDACHLKQTWKQRESAAKKDAAGKDLIITLGGDGTFLTAAHVAKEKQPILGVNADVSRKEGFLLKANRRTIAAVMKRVMAGRYSLKKLDTIEARVNGKLLPTRAMNEFFIGADKPYLTARYEVQLGKRKETHRSSGLLVATETGMHAWAGSAGKRKLAVKTGEAGFVVREPYQHKLFADYKIMQGKLKTGERITFISRMKKAILVADSLGREFTLRNGDRVSLSPSGRTIAAIQPHKR